ncbi:MAG: hypothetical protein M0Z66_03990 [Thermaerobacter sp.]|nr:hypothetical protein [Thermaerobacter sp.]
MFDCGAILTGRRTFDIANGWGGHHPSGAPFFLLTHTPPQRWVGPGTGGTVVTDGLESALKLARRAAGERTIAVGSADVAQQCLRAGLLDEIHLNLPALKGGDSEEAVSAWLDIPLAAARGRGDTFFGSPLTPLPSALPTSSRTTGAKLSGITIQGKPGECVTGAKTLGVVLLTGPGYPSGCSGGKERAFRAILQFAATPF